MKIAKKVTISFFSYCSLQFSRNSPLRIWTSKVCYKDISKTVTASSLRFGHLIEVGEKINW